MTHFLHVKDIRRYKRNLPHWIIGEAVYFVTFGLHDAIPRHRIDELKQIYERHRERVMKDPNAARLTELSHWCHRVLYDQEFDRGRGECLLGRAEVAEILWQSIFHFDGERYEIYAVVIMPNHVHVVRRTLTTDHPINKIVGSWKSFTSNAVRRELGLHVKWRAECFDRVIRTPDELLDTVRYVIENPTKAGFEEWEWVWFSPERVK